MKNLELQSEETILKGKERNHTTTMSTLWVYKKLVNCVSVTIMERENILSDGQF